jgi:hypothetical protein
MSVSDTMFLTHLTYDRRNVGVPCGRHSWEQMMFNLEIQSARDISGYGTTVRAGCFDLGFEPTNLSVTVTFGLIGWVTVDMFKVVR